MEAHYKLSGYWKPPGDICEKAMIVNADYISHMKYEPPHDKANEMTVHPAKTQISQGIHPVWSESSQCPQWVAKDPNSLHTDGKDSHHGNFSV